MKTSKLKKLKPAEPVTQTHEEKVVLRSATHRKTLLQLEDDFAEFASLSAFLTNAFVVTIKEHEWLTPEIVSGARLCSCRLQQRAVELKDELHVLRLNYGNTPAKGKKKA